MKTQKQKSFHPRAQIIVTGKPVTPEQAKCIRAFMQTMSFRDWCSDSGTIGHLGAFVTETTHQQLVEELTVLATFFPFLDLGVTVMSGPPGSPVQPIVSFTVRTKVKEATNVHITHPPPIKI